MESVIITSRLQPERSNGVSYTAGLEELETAFQVLVQHANNDGGYSKHYDTWQTILHGLGKLIATKRRESSNK